MLEVRLMEFGDHLESYIGSNCPIIQIVSHEWERVESKIGMINNKLNKKTGVKREQLKWNKVSGMQIIENRNVILPSDDQKAVFNKLVNPVSVLKWYIGTVRKEGYGTPSILHMEDMQNYLDEDAEDYIEIVSWLREGARSGVKVDKDGNSYKKTIILGTTRSSIVQELEKEMPILDLPLPEEKELGIVIKNCIKEAENEIPHDEELDELIKATMGLTVMEATNAYNKTIYTHECLTEEQIPFILNEKKQIIKRSGILEYIEPSNEEVGGLGKLTEWLSLRKKAFSKDARDYGLEYPQGILLLGFPGCGKSLTAVHTAKTWNYPLLRFDIGRAFGGLVGESERNMRDALKVAEAISPCILWIDEIEKGLSGSESSGQTDGGTSARVLGTFLTWMQEKTAPVFVLATSNNIDQMPPELSRKGRFDEIFFVDLPNQNSRKEILGIHINSIPLESRGEIEKYNLEEMANISSGYTGAELKQAVVEGMHDSFSEGRKLTQEDISKSLRSTYPMYKVMRETIEKMRLRKGNMYKPAEDGDSEPLPPNGSEGEVILTPRERRRNNPFDGE